MGNADDNGQNIYATREGYDQAPVKDKILFWHALIEYAKATHNKSARKRCESMLQDILYSQFKGYKMRQNLEKALSHFPQDRVKCQQMIDLLIEDALGKDENDLSATKLELRLEEIDNLEDREEAERLMDELIAEQRREPGEEA